MTPAAPRIPPRLLDAVAAHDDGSRPIAEIIRRVGDEADRLGITRPSYERIRQLVHENRARPCGPSDLRLGLEATALLRSKESVAYELARRPL